MQQPVRHTKCEGNYINGLIFHCVAGLAQRCWNVAIWRHEISFNWMHPTLIGGGRFRATHLLQNTTAPASVWKLSFRMRGGKKSNIKERLLGTIIHRDTVLKHSRLHLHWTIPNPCCFRACQTGFMVISVCQGLGLARNDSGMVYQSETWWSKG